MDYCNACNKLDLVDGFTEKELKHNYYLKALQYHPDKNTDADAKKKFQEILAAYDFLKKHKDTYSFPENNENSYSNILEQFISGILDKNIDTNNFLSILNNKCSEISIELLQHFSKDALLKLHKFANLYSDILHINKDIIQKLEILINDHTKNDIIQNIRPSINNLIDNDIYKLCYEGEIYYIPMWHHELVYELSGNLLIVQCEPQLPEYITIHQYNNLYVNLSTTVKSILNDNSITINIGEKKYIIPVSELYIRKYQRYIFKREGIPLVDMNEVYNVENKANIYVDICLTDVM
jgi:hypothetical protein